MMHFALSSIRLGFSLYVKHVAVLLPLMGVTALGLFLERIPYANLYKDEIFTAILIFDWVVILWLARLKTQTMVGIAILLFFLTLPLHYLRFHWYVEMVGTLSYVIILLAMVFEGMRNLMQGNGNVSQAQAQRELFNREFSQISSALPAAWQRSYIQRIQETLFTLPAKRNSVIELGCGDGKLSVAIAQMGYRVTACDISDTSMQLVKKFATEAKVTVEAVQCDVTKLPFPSESFDYAIAGAILEHLEDEQTALAEWARVLKKGGRIMIVTPLRQRHVLPLWWVLNWFHDRRLGHVRRYDAARYEAIAAHGLRLDTVRYTGHTPKVLLTIAYMFTKVKKLELWAEDVDRAFEHIEYDGNNIIGFFTKK